MTMPRHPLSRRDLLALGGAGAALGIARPARPAAPPRLDTVLGLARALPRLQALIVAQHGQVVIAERLRGPPLDRPVNIKSLAKTVLATLVGVAIDRGVLHGPDQPITTVLGPLVPEVADPRLAQVTIGHLLAMQAGLERTSGANYGRWVTSPNWVAHALSRPFVAAPGGPMLYSTGSSHLLSAILTRATGETTHALATDWLGRPLGIAIPHWDRDPQGIYLGGNNMLLAPDGLLRFGEMIRGGGTHDGRRIVSAAWIATSWQPRTASRFTGHGYGYGWFMTDIDGHAVRYGWGYGGQMLHLIPSLGLTLVMTSDPSVRSREAGHMAGLRGLVRATIAQAAA